MALHALRFAPRSLTLRLQARRECPRRAQRSWVAGGSSPYGLAWLGALVLVFSFCGPTAAQSNRVSPPQTAFGDAIYGLGRQPASPGSTGKTGSGSICVRLNDTFNTTTSSTGTKDLVERCNDLIDQENDPLRQVASEEVSSLGRKAVETSTKAVGARLAALRRGASGINIQGLGVNSQEPTLPGTLVAALGPVAAVSSTTPTLTPTTPSPFAGLGLFANGLFAVGDRDPTSNEDGFDFHTYGVIAGVDYRFTPKLVLGAAFTYQSAGFDHGVGHPLLLLYDAKAPNCGKNNEFKDLGHYSEWPKVADAVIKANRQIVIWIIPAPW